MSDINFHSLADQYLLAAEILFAQAYGVGQPLHSGPIDPKNYSPLIRPIGFLMGHAIELLLKNNISKREADPAYLKSKVKHNLRFALQHEANKPILNVIPEICDRAEQMLNAHSDNIGSAIAQFYEHFDELDRLYGSDKNFAYKYPSTPNAQHQYPRPIFILTVFRILIDQYPHTLLT